MRRYTMWWMGTLLVALLSACGSSSSSTSTAAATPPAAPVGVTITPGDTVVDLAWTASAGATGYNVYRSITAGFTIATGNKINGTAVTAALYHDTGLTDGAAVYYKVTAVNAAGESAPSTQVSGTPQIPAPGAPTALSAAPGISMVDLSWTAPAGTVTSYNVYRSTTTGFTYATGTQINASPVSVTSYSDTTAANGTHYYYVVTGVNAGGESAQSTEAGGTPAPLPTVGVSNVHDKGVIHSGFLVGTAADTPGTVAGVDVSLDGGAYAAATGTASWSFKLPSGANTWRDGSPHTVSVRSRNANGTVSAVTALNVRKGANQDLNGDGFADLAVANEADQVFLFLSGNGAGVQSGPTSSASATLTGPAGGGIGSATLFADINGDGYADLVVGAPYANSQLGAVYIYLSAGASGIATAASPDTTLTGTLGGGVFGYAAAAGDINGDGYADLVVGTFASVAYVFYSAGASGIATAASPDATLTGSGASFFGSALALGDVTGDGFADLAVGARGLTLAVYVFHSAGSSGIATGAIPNTTLTGPARSQFGVAVALGDITGDGYADLLVGANKLNSFSGAAYVYSSSGSSGIATGTSPSTILMGPANSAFGTSVALGDVNGDGNADVLIGTNGGNGAAYLFLSAGATGVTSGTDASASAAFTATDYEALGYDVAFADFNGDGYADVVTFAPAYGPTSNQGDVYGFTSAGAGGVSTADQTQAQLTLTGAAASTNAFGGAARGEF